MRKEFDWPPLFWRWAVLQYDYDQSPDWYSWGI
jgi:hypothetical protein